MHRDSQGGCANLPHIGRDPDCVGRQPRLLEVARREPWRHPLCGGTDPRLALHLPEGVALQGETAESASQTDGAYHRPHALPCAQEACRSEAQLHRPIGGATDRCVEVVLVTSAVLAAGGALAASGARATSGVRAIVQHLNVDVQLRR